LGLKFRDFLELADFPFKEKKCLIELPKLLQDILDANSNKEEKIRYLKEQKIIFLDELKGKKNKKRENKIKK
jgi:hypothetical protein